MMDDVDVLLGTSVKGQKLDQIYWSQRAASMAVSQLPLLTALGTKNNLVSCKSGQSKNLPPWLFTLELQWLLV
jgi:hypothetical protein